MSSVGLALVVPWLIPLLFGSDFNDAVPLAWILLLATVPTQMSSVLASMLTAAGFPGAAAKSEFIALARRCQCWSCYCPSLELLQLHSRLFCLQRSGSSTYLRSHDAGLTRALEPSWY